MHYFVVLSIIFFIPSRLENIKAHLTNRALTTANMLE